MGMLLYLVIFKLSDRFLFQVVGQFKDDCLQDHVHQYVRFGVTNRSSGSISTADSPGSYENTGSASGRAKSVTHGKQKGVKYIIKAL